MPCAARVGGNWNNGSNAGPLYWNCNNAPSNSNVNYRARHSYSNITVIMHAVFLAAWQKIVVTAGFSRRTHNDPETIRKKTKYEVF